MPIANVIDHRSNKYKVDAMIVFESTWHDNSIEGATQFSEDNDAEDEITHIGIRQTTIDLAIRYATIWKYSITMFIYDVGADNYIDCESIEEVGSELRLVPSESVLKLRTSVSDPVVAEE